MIAEVEQYADNVLAMRRRGWFIQWANLSDSELLDRLDSESLTHEMARFKDWMGSYPWEEPTEPEIRFCRLPDRPAFRGQTCKWPASRMTWNCEGGLKGVEPADFTAATMEAFRRWTAVSGIDPQYTSNPKTANIWLHAANLGGPGSVLADSQLPCGYSMDDQAEQRYDGERWTIGTHVNGKIELIRVITHELGHALGSDHIAAGNLLAPTYSAAIDRPQPGDIAEMVKRYGPPIPVTPPTPVPVPTPAPSGEVVLTVPKGTVVRVPGYRVTPLAG